MAEATGLSGRVTVDLAALRANWQALDKVSAGALTGAVVKADAYGTGIVPASRALYEAGARFFFAATPDECLTVRETLPEAHIFVLDGLYPGAAPLYVEKRLMPVLSSLAMLEEWLHFCVQHNEAFAAALHFDTGMNRLGIRLDDIGIVKQELDRVGFEPQMIMSHFACADQPQHEKTRTQLALFERVLAQFPAIPASLSNSAGMMTGRQHHFQMVRPGIALYGARAVSGRRNPMARVVRLEVPILQVKLAKTGESVGYGATQTLARDSRLAVLGAGYADGVLRALSASNAHAGGRVAIRGQIAPLVGRISMDLMAADITDLQGDLPAPGDMAELFGNIIDVDEQADAAGTIGYELLTGLTGGRYSRHYVDGDRNE